MDVMIYGGNFIGRGAEAMMLTVRDSLATKVPSAHCCVPVSDEHDRQRAVAEKIMPLWPALPSLPVRIWQRGLTQVGLPCGGSRITPEAFVNRRMSNPFRCTRWIIDISGFASSDQFPADAARQRWLGMRKALNSGNQLIFMPQSWGPFKNPKVRAYTRHLLERAKLVFAREPESYEHLLSLDLPQTVMVGQGPDIAFHFRGCRPDRAHEILAALKLATSDGPLIGFTPNMRIYERTSGEGVQNSYFRAVVDLIRHFTDRHGARVLLIAHEISRFRKNDPELCQELEKAAERADRVAIICGEQSAVEVKSIIGCLDFLVASRYHSLVAGLSLRIPVAVIGWSHKYDDLMKAVGLGRWVADPVRGDASLMGETIREAWDHRDTIRAAEQKAVPHLEQESAASLAGMCDLVGATAG